MTSLAALPDFLAHFLTGLGLLALALGAYVRLTPHDEFSLIRAGNSAAAISLGGALLGFALGIGAAIRHSTGLADAALWGMVALVAQLGAFLGMTWLLPGWRGALERGDTAGAILAAGMAVAVGLVNAASLAP